MRELRERYEACPTGSAVITGGGRLPVKAVIHAVGARWRAGDHAEPELLASAYRAAFALARDHGHATVAAPSISTGIYGFPIARAAPIALAAARDALQEPETSITEITFALFSASDVSVFAEALAAL